MLIQRSIKRLVLSLMPAFLLVGVAWSSVSADQNNPELDEVFSELNTMQPGPETRRRARFLQNKIWLLWYENEQDEVRLAMEDGVEAMNRGNFEASIAAFGRAIDADRDFAEAWNRRATVYFLNGQYDNSLADVERVLDLEPRHFGALSGAAQIYMKQNKLEEAAQSLRQALRVNRHMTELEQEIERIEGLIKAKSI